MEARNWIYVAFFLLFLTALPIFIPHSKPKSESFDAAKVLQISWKPRAFLYKGFLSHEECDHLIQLGKNKLQESMVADSDSGESVKSQVRTSSGMFLDKRQDEILAGIEKRIAAWTFLPEENAESLQILRYVNGQKYDPHFDYFSDKNNQVRGGHRAATLLMYLSDVKKGGETVFPNAVGWESQLKDDTFSDCAKKGYAVKPIKGDAVLFFNLHPDGTTDPHSLHGSCPVIEGEKWSAPKWIHVRSFDVMPRSSSAEECVDENEMCPQWSASGECESNSLYMIGTSTTLGNCRMSCGVCDPSPKEEDSSSPEEKDSSLSKEEEDSSLPKDF